MSRSRNNFWYIVLFCIQCSWLRADAFDQNYQQQTLHQSIKDDSGLTYDRYATDFNIEAPTIAYKEKGRFEETTLSPGLKQFNTKDTLLGLLAHPELNMSETRDFLNRIQSSGLMTYQYTSPAQMDLYKSYVTNANLRLLLRYMQYNDIEEKLNDPLTILRKQAEMDCLRRSRSGDIELAFRNCVNLNESSNDPLENLNNIKDGRRYISGMVDVVETLLLRVIDDNLKFNGLKDILPQYRISKDRIIYIIPQKTIRQYYLSQRSNILGKLDQALSQYTRDHTISEQILLSLNIPSAPITEKLIRQLFVLDKEKRYIAISKLAASRAYVKTYDIYQQAHDWLNRVLLHPQIESGLKVYIRLAQEEIDASWRQLTHEKDIIQINHQETGQLLNEIEKERLKHIAIDKDIQTNYE